ncbi:MAG: cysteine rich repeat-containing protein [Xanthobacteraceae bacterium]
MAEKMEPTEHQSAGAAAGTDDTLHKFGERLRALNDLQRATDERRPLEDLPGSGDDKVSKQFGDLLHPSPQPKPAADLHEVLLGIGRHLDTETLALKTIYDRLLAIEQQTKKRGARGLARYLVAICIGVAAILAWQSYGEATKQMIATSAPKLGWSPETKRMIASWIQQFGWTTPGASPESAAVQQQSVPETQVATVAQTVPVPKTPATPSIDPEQVHQIAVDLAALRQTVDQLAASQDQMVHQIDTLQTSNQEILVRIPAPPPPPPIAAPGVAGRPAPGAVLPSEKTQNTASTSASLPVDHSVTEGALRASCGPDVQRLCGGTSRENGGVIKCLSSHRTELSPTCDAYFNRAAQKGAPKATSPSR